MTHKQAKPQKNDKPKEQKLKEASTPHTKPFVRRMGCGGSIRQNGF
ncbi:MAG: hypothetical protein IJ881_07885 [Neisseriaceae bacterium]|nr:hypothetical protein [Neisseriaceae bacterium]